MTHLKPLVAGEVPVRKPVFLSFMEISLIYNVVLVSVVQQSDSVIHTHIFFFIMIYYRILNIVPCAI